MCMQMNSNSELNSDHGLSTNIEMEMREKNVCNPNNMRNQNMSSSTISYSSTSSENVSIPASENFKSSWLTGSKLEVLSSRLSESDVMKPISTDSKTSSTTSINIEETPAVSGLLKASSHLSLDTQIMTSTATNLNVSTSLIPTELEAPFSTAAVLGTPSTKPVALAALPDGSLDVATNITKAAELETVSHASSDLNISSTTPNALKTPVSSEIEEISIYDVRSHLKRNITLAALSMIAFLLPFCDTIYLPVLKDIETDLKTSETLVAISISIYIFMSGAFSLLWGCVSDRFGRKITTIIALVVFIMASIVCIFSRNIAMLIVFRAIEGGTVSATLVIGQALVADIYPEDKRGLAESFFFVPFNIGPVIGPLIGGPLASAFSWRSCFVFLSIFSFCVLVTMMIIVPETHQYFVKERFHKANPNKRIIDAEPNELFPFQKPWKPLVYLTDLTILPYIAVMTTTFATLYTSLTLFSTYLSESPYNYSETIIGVLFVPCGVAMFLSSIMSGWLSDKASKYYGHDKCPEGRLVPSLILSIFHPIGLLIYGWMFHCKANIAGPIIGSILLSIGQAVLEPAVAAYLTAKKQKEAGAVAAANTFLNFCAAGVIISVSVPLENAMHTGPYFSLMCGINIVSISIALILVWRCIIQSRRITEKQNNVTPELKNPIEDNHITNV